VAARLSFIHPVRGSGVLLIAGGEADFNTGSVLRRARQRGMDARELLVGVANPALTWDFQAGELRLDGRAVRPDAVFLRYDVFPSLADPRPQVAFRAQAWFGALHGWLLAHPAVRMLNRRSNGQANKPFILHLAKGIGLRIPFTLVTNELDALEAIAPGLGPLIAKPVPGGGFAQGVDELLAGTQRRDGRSAAPAFVQGRLVPPEVRVYGVGEGKTRRFVAFRVESDALDYRADDAARVVHLPLGQVDADAVEGLGRLMDALAMDYGAADFKACPDTGRLVFLEINSGPMFAAFDDVSGFAVSDAILDFLTGA
jgi:hypothetical protein